MKSTTFLLLATLILTGCATGPARNEDAALKKLFHKVDTSGDRKISRKEFTDFMIEEAFKRYDKDGNGYVTLEEYVAGGGTTRGFKTINKSGTGKVTLAEAKASPLVRQQMSKPFIEANADTNGDGYVSFDEFVAFRKKYYNAVR